MYEEEAPTLRLVYDQEEPIGRFGRGTHYSVFRGVVWQTPDLRFSDAAKIHDVAVIWDEDHDTRILYFLERAYHAGLLSAILVVGERKGTVSVIISDESAAALGASGVTSLRERLRKLTDVKDDSWSLELSVFGESSSIIAASDADIITYVGGVNLLWRLGSKPTEEVLMR
jgi:hypothetical protein